MSILSGRPSSCVSSPLTVESEAVLGVPESPGWGCLGQAMGSGTHRPVQFSFGGEHSQA